MIDAKKLIKTRGIAKAQPHDTLAAALLKTRSSHDAVFVFEGDDYQGVINPYHTMIKTSYPGNTKIAHCLHHAPKVTESLSISHLARMFVDSKLHYLPVMGAKNAFLGIVSARRLLAVYRNSPYFAEDAGTYVLSKKQKLQTILETDTVTQALSHFRKKHISKLLVVDKAGRMRGMLSYFDLIMNLSAPKEKTGKRSPVGEGKGMAQQPIRQLMKTQLLTLAQSKSVGHALQLVLDHEIGSVVVTDSRKKPIGLITTSDFLHMLIKSPAQKQVQVSGRNLSDKNMTILRRFANPFERAMSKLRDVERVDLTVKEEKQGGVFRAMMAIIPARGRAKVKTREGKNLQKLLSEFKKIKTK